MMAPSGSAFVHRPTGAPSEFMHEACDLEPEDGLDAATMRRLSWWKATYEIQRRLVCASFGKPEPPSNTEQLAFARRLAFVLWLKATGRFTWSPAADLIPNEDMP